MAHGIWKVAETSDTPVAEQAQYLDHVPELADIAGPVVGLERAQHRPTDARRAYGIPRTHLPDELPYARRA